MAVFVGNSVTPISTLANNKRSCSKRWKTSGQNCVFTAVFPAKILAQFYHASRRSRLSRTSRAPSRLFRPRPIDCDSGRDRQMKTFPVFGQVFRTSPKRFFFVFRARYIYIHIGPSPDLDLHPKRSPWPDFRDRGVCIRATNAGKK